MAPVELSAARVLLGPAGTRRAERELCAWSAIHRRSGGAAAVSLPQRSLFHAGTEALQCLISAFVLGSHSLH